MNRYALVAIVSIAAALAGCSGKSAPEEKPASPSSKVVHVDPATAGSISGTVSFKGTVPKAASIDMSADPACKGQNASEEFVVHDGKLGNVLVYVKNTSGLAVAAPQGDIVVKQEGCRYVPHVIALMAGGTVKFVNTDDTMHNIHPMPHENKEWNAAQMSHAEPLEKKFTKPELMIPVKCNQHPWMKMYVNVADSPFFAVTGPDGKFDIKGLPPGVYTVAAVHESMGAQEQQITVGPREDKKLGFTFEREKGAAAAK